MADVAATLAQVEALTAAISRAAAANDWDGVCALDEARYTLLAGLPPSCFDGADPALQLVLEQALAVTQAVLGQARAAQTLEADALREVTRGRRVARAYHAASG